MTAHATAMYELARARHCVLSGRRGCRIDVDAAGNFAAGWLCHNDFESQPTRFKLTSAQDQFRALIAGGTHPRLAMRRCMTTTRDEPLGDMSADHAWFRSLMEDV